MMLLASTKIAHNYTNLKIHRGENHTNLKIINVRWTQKQLATEIGISPSRISDYVSGRAEPTLKIARSLCQVLGIRPAAILGI